MRSRLPIAGLAYALTFTFAMLSGCAAGDRRPKPATDQPAATPQTAAPAAEAPQPEEREAKRDELKKSRKELRQKEHRLVELERNLEVGRHKLRRTQLAAEHADARNAAALAKAETELDVARRRLSTFNERDVPSRLAWTELSLRGAEDGAKEAQEEIEQLEKMYGEEEFADQTKEIVLERGRRRLERSLQDLELRRKDAATAREQKIPLERSEHEKGVHDAEVALKVAQNDIAVGEIDQQIALITAELEITKTEQELEDVREELADAKEKLAKLEKEVETSAAAEEPRK
jgi:hypothetical protein